MMSKKLIATTLCLLYAITYISGQALGEPVIIVASLLIGYISLFFTIRIERFFLLFTFISVICFLLVLLFNDSYPFERLIFNSCFLYLNGLLAHSVLNNRINGEKILKGVIYSLMVYFIYCLASSLMSSQTVYSYMDKQLVGFSYNYISGLLVLSSSMLFASAKNNGTYNRNSSISLSFIILVICFMLYGRSGIIFSFLLFAITMRDVLNFKSYINVFIVLFLLICTMVVVSYYSDDILQMIMSSKFKEGIDSPRISMLQDYFSQLDLKTLLLGVDLHNIPLIVSFNFNPHNSFLNLHAMYGFFSIFFTVLLLSVVIYFFFILDLVVVLLLCVYIGRGLFDTIIFPGVTDFMFFYVVSRLWLNKTYLNRGSLC